MGAGIGKESKYMGIRGAFEVRLGSVQVPFGIRSGSVQGKFGICLGAENFRRTPAAAKKKPQPKIFSFIQN